MAASKGTQNHRYISHRRDDGAEELVTTHLCEVAQMASDFGRRFGAQQSCRALGMSHDIGKFSEAFQKRIRGEGPKVDHSTAGAYELEQKGLWWLSYCVSGHHGGLPDGQAPDTDSTWSSRIKKASKGRIPSYKCPQEESEIDALPSLRALADELANKLNQCLTNGGYQKDQGLQQSFTTTFFTRMCYSCLVDADFLCTERFMSGAPREQVPCDSIETILRRFENKVSAFYPPHGKLGTLRCKVSDECHDAATNHPGVYSLTVPTGGGKTLAVMRFALNHAQANHMNRIIVAEPYTAIIEQTAQTYREYLDGNSTENVLEHHSNFDFDSLDEDPLRKNLRLAAENWDMPIVVTTNVQLFESLFASSSSRCRKLHNIANSVIVLDEAQTIPLNMMEASVRALVELVTNYNCTIVLCTATQPALNVVFREYGIAVREIVSDVRGLFHDLRRVSYKNLGTLADDELVGRLAAEDQALCVVNSRAQAKNVADLLWGQCAEESVYHLSTLMYPAHREAVLDIVRKRLKAGLPCKVVSTSLIEAGVDLDFPVVYRSAAGLDSIVQAAGRCNRENKHPYDSSYVYVFTAGDNPDTGRPYATPREVRHRAGVTQAAIPAFDSEGDVEDLGSLANIKTYFMNLLSIFRSGERHASAPLEDLRVCDGDLLPIGPEGKKTQLFYTNFESASRDFKFIDDASTAVIIPAQCIESEISRLREEVATRGDMRRIARYSVNVYQHTLKTLIQAGKVEVAGGAYVLTDPERWYLPTTGLDCGDIQGEGMFW